MASRPTSYAQRFEDLYLLRCFRDRADGFYIDIGSGHPVYDNVSFAFYLKGWRGVTVEPNPRLAALTRAVRRRDRSHEVVVGASAGETTFYLVRDFHGFSTTIATNTDAALSLFDKGCDEIRVEVTTLAALCESGAPAAIDFLKVDVEGAEAEVLISGDWTRFRPRIVVVEALAPFTQAPAWDAFEPILIEHGYHYVWFDTLNRYYLADEARDLARYFDGKPISPGDADLFRDEGPALGREAHPDHHLARLLATANMADLPLHEPTHLLEMLTSGLSPSALSKPVEARDLPAMCLRVFGRASTAYETRQLTLPEGAILRDLYARLVDSDVFRTACGRIAAGYAW